MESKVDLFLLLQVGYNQNLHGLETVKNYYLMK